MKAVGSTGRSDAIAMGEAEVSALPGFSPPRIAGRALAISCSGRLADPVRLDRDHSVLVRWRTGFPCIRSVRRMLLTKVLVSRPMGNYPVRLAFSIDMSLHAK
jgi:hypothetical protein